MSEGRKRLHTDGQTQCHSNPNFGSDSYLDGQKDLAQCAGVHNVEHKFVHQTLAFLGRGQLQGVGGSSVCVRRKLELRHSTQYRHALVVRHVGVERHQTQAVIKVADSIHKRRVAATMDKV